MKEFDAIESLEFAAEANLANGLPDFIYQITRERSFSALLDAASTSTEVTMKVMERIRRLVDVSVDPRYENPLDTAVAAYLAILSSVNPTLAQMAASYAYRLQNAWWARKTATHVIEGLTRNSDADTASKQDLPERTYSTADVKLTHAVPYMVAVGFEAHSDSINSLPRAS